MEMTSNIIRNDAITKHEMAKHEQKAQASIWVRTGIIPAVSMAYLQEGVTFDMQFWVKSFRL